MPKYRVHIYATVRVPVEVEAEDVYKAAQLAESRTDMYHAVKEGDSEYAEEITGFHVDKLNSKGQCVEETSLDANFRSEGFVANKLFVKKEKQ